MTHSKPKLIWCLVAQALCLIAPNAFAASLTPTADARQASVAINICPGFGAPCQLQFVPAFPSAPYAHFTGNAVYGSSYGFQDSSLSPTGFGGTGAVGLSLPSLDVVSADGTVTSFFDVSFVLDVQAPVSLSGNLSIGSNAASGGQLSSLVRLCTSTCPGTELFSQSLQNGAGLPNTASLPFSFSSVLPGGAYRLQLVATNFDVLSHNATSTASFDFTLTVPEPSGLSSVAAAAGLFALVRRYLSFVR